MNPYDALPYTARPFRKSHPDRLATIGILHGLHPPAVERSRILELGCGLGGNLLPMAEQLPDARFVGVDGSLRQIETAGQAADAAGLKNIELMHADIRTLGPELGDFDFIIAHGLYSWVPADVQNKILQICGEQLTAAGVAFVSYNCYPGWHLRGTVHHLLRYATRDVAEPSQRVREARRLTEGLLASLATGGNADAAAIKQELELVAKQDDRYLFHEYLAEVNEPVYFHQFMERAAANGLQYLADTDFGFMSPDNLPQAVRQQLAAVAAGPLEMEQLLDFIQNRKFRQTLLCRQGKTVDRSAAASRVDSLYVASSARPEGEVDVRSASPVTFRNSVAAMVSHEPLIKAAMLELSGCWPRPIPFGSLLMAARRRVAGSGATIQPKADDQSWLINGMVATGFSTTLIELSTIPAAFNLQPGERPLASPTARWQAETSETVTNRRHEPVELSYVQRLMMRFLDGHHDRSEIVAALQELMKDETLVIHDAGQRIEAGPRAQQVLTEAINSNLPILARLCLLC